MRRKNITLASPMQAGDNIRDLSSQVRAHAASTYDGHQPGLVAHIYVSHPRSCFGFCCCFYFLVTIVLTVLLAAVGLNPINLDNLTSFTIGDPQNKYWLREQAHLLMTSNADYGWSDSSSSDDDVTCRQSDLMGYFWVVAETEGNILTTKNLKILENWERKIISAPGYENYCYLNTADCSDDDVLKNYGAYLFTTNGADCCISRYTNLDAVSGKGSYNFTDENGCLHVTTPMYYFRKYGDAEFSDIAGTIATIKEKSVSDYNSLQKLLGAEFSASNPKSEVAKIEAYFNNPLNHTLRRKQINGNNDDDPTTVDDDEDDHYGLDSNIMGDWMNESYESWADSLNSKSPVKGYYYYTPGGVDISGYVTSDLSLAIVGIVLVFGYMMIQIRSVFLASCAIFQIFCSFFGGNLVYRYLWPTDDGFGYKNYFTLFEALAIFIIIGIGADDCFVFLDMWRDYGPDGSGKSVDTVQRLSATWAHAGKAMLVTSLTTFCSFLTNLDSDFAFLQAFGTYCALIVLINYIMVMTYFPAAVLFYHRVFEKTACCCGYCCCCTGGKEPVPNGPSDNWCKSFAKWCRRQCSTSFDLGRWFRETYSPALYKARFLVLAVYFAFVLSFLVLACLVKGKSFTTADYLNPETNWYKFWFAYQNKFGGNNFPVQANLLFGFDVDKPVTYGSDFKSYTWAHSAAFGNANYNESWSLADPEGQIQLKETCTWLRNGRWVTEGMHIDKQFGVNHVDDDDVAAGGDDDSVAPNYLYGITCPMEALAKFENVTAYRKDIDVGDQAHWTIRDTSADCKYCFSYFNTYPKPTGAGGEFKLDAPLEYINQTSSIKDGCECMGIFPVPEKVCIADRAQFREDTRFKCETSDNFKLDVEKFISAWGWSDYVYATEKGDGSLNRIVGTITSVSLSRSMLSTEYENGIQIVKAWDEWAEKYNKWVEKHTNSQMKLFVYIPQTTVWVVTDMLCQNAIHNTIQSMVLCFLIILFATENWILALMASANIASIVIVIFGTIYAAGWGLNLFESILVVIIVGFSCDFTIHLADSYIECDKPKRYEKVQASLGVTGVSIVSGSLSTLLATAPMMAANINFFSRFAQIMFITMALSTVFTLGPLSVMLMMFGPEGHQGMLSNFYGPLITSAFHSLEEKEAVLRRQSMMAHTTTTTGNDQNAQLPQSNPIHGEEEEANSSTGV